MGSTGWVHGDARETTRGTLRNKLCNLCRHAAPTMTVLLKDANSGRDAWVAGETIMGLQDMLVVFILRI
jgi:hypothetical protein